MFISHWLSSMKIKNLLQMHSLTNIQYVSRVGPKITTILFTVCSTFHDFAYYTTDFFKSQNKLDSHRQMDNTGALLYLKLTKSLLGMIIKLSYIDQD